MLAEQISNVGNVPVATVRSAWLAIERQGSRFSLDIFATNANGKSISAAIVTRVKPVKVKVPKLSSALVQWAPAMHRRRLASESKANFWR